MFDGVEPSVGALSTKYGFVTVQHKGSVYHLVQHNELSPLSAAFAAGLEDREYKRNSLLEVVDYADAAGRALFADVRVLEDTFTMVSWLL